MTIQPRLFALIVIGFIIAAVVGTVSHEVGHYIDGKAVGQNLKINYKSVSNGNISTKDVAAMREMYQKDEAKILAAENSPEKERYLKYRQILSNRSRTPTARESFLITLGGPLQTMLTGTLGFLLLCYNIKRIKLTGTLTASQWLIVLLCFFWSRQLANIIIWSGNTCLLVKSLILVMK